jgi:hypothetical protein
LNHCPSAGALLHIEATLLLVLSARKKMLEKGERIKCDVATLSVAAVLRGRAAIETSRRLRSMRRIGCSEPLLDAPTSP